MHIVDNEDPDIQGIIDLEHSPNKVPDTLHEMQSQSRRAKQSREKHNSPEKLLNEDIPVIKKRKAKSRKTSKGGLMPYYQSMGVNSTF